LVREELLTVAVLLLALAATLVVLGLQWLDSGQPAGSTSSIGPALRISPAGPERAAVMHNILGGHT